MLHAVRTARRPLVGVTMLVAMFAAMWPTLWPRAAGADTRVVPWISVAERYDSNVYFFRAGQNLQDYVTTVVPGARIEHRGQLVEGNVTAQMTGEYYVKNPGLNYFFPSGGLYLNLDKVVGQWDQRWKLQVSDNVTYTPRPPAFVAPIPQNASVSPTIAASTPDFIRGIQAVRANSLMNYAAVNSQYSLTPSASLVGSYVNQFMRFGNRFTTTPGGGFFTTKMQTLNFGPQYQVTPRDVGSITFQYQNMHFSQGSNFNSTFQVFGATGGWRHNFFKNLSVNANVGIVSFSPRGGTQYLANGAVTWEQRNTTTILSYSRSVYPSFFIAAVPLLSQVVAASVVHRLSDNWSVSGTVNYARNESISGPSLTFITYGATASANYQISRTITATAGYTYNSFDASFVGSGYSFNRNVLSVMIRSEWR
jgi:hypothetical protein